MSAWQWWWGFGSDPETFNGPFESRVKTDVAAQIAVARSREGSQDVTICEGRLPALTDDIFNIEEVLAWFEDWNDNAADENEPLIIASEEQQEELARDLSAVFAAWRGRHGLGKAVRIETRNAEVVHMACVEARP